MTTRDGRARTRDRATRAGSSAPWTSPYSRARGGDAHRRARRTMAIERMSSKSHIRVRVRATVRPRAPPRSGDATRAQKKIRVARRRGRGPASARVVRARRPVALSLSFSLFPRATLASRAEAARRARVSRGRDAASSRSRDDAVGRPTTRAREARSRGGRRPSMDDFERARRDARAFARRVDGSRSSHRVVRTLDGVAPRARGRVVVASTESNARASPSSVSSLTTGCPPSANQSNRSRDPERRRARSTPRVAARSRCVRVRVRPIHRLDSTRRATPTPARPSERNSNRHPHRRRASLRRPNRAPPPVTHATPRPTERDRSIDRSRSVGRGVAWVTGGGARFGRRRDARRRWGCLFEFRSDGRAGVGVARRVESSRWMGRTRTRTHRERAATRGVDLARRRSGSRERFD